MKTLASMRTTLLGFCALLLFWSMTALAATPLVDVAWVKANIGKPGIVFLDLQPPADYLRGHIPGAVNTSFEKDGWREERARDKVPDMLPENLDKLAALIGRLGIDNKTHVVLVPPGQSHLDMGWATRIYWTFKVLGHDEVSILDGGMKAYTADKKNPLQAGPITPEPKTFVVHFRPEYLATVDDVKHALASKKVVLVDLRPEDQYVGINRNPKATMNGTLPGAKNLPSPWLTDNAGGTFRNLEQLRELAKIAGVPTTGPQIEFCNTGHFAANGWFVMHELLGNKEAKLYDGSMVEWTLTKAGPVEQKVKLP
ncbi:sulfurtransferase [Thiobacter aerophilum]|uniref:Sulfurtransferase n=1 Tax=Thiobacter aerophilum TaxID=3121275 RepID=A0ABV0EBP6_9BURK